MKRFYIAWLVVAVLLGIAAYRNSWWLSIVAFLVLLAEYVADQFEDVKARLEEIENRTSTIEGKLDLAKGLITDLYNAFGRLDYKP
jgi:uncharacterized membrane protein